MNGIVVLFAFPLVIGIIVLMMGLNHTSLTDKVEFNKSQLIVLEIVGAVLTFVGAVGFLYGLYDDISFHEKKDREAEERRLKDEQWNQQRQQV
ncbi:hypothetical protein L596_004379 [Steinernema carpocapsae]|uniref:Uncharacterized protein n=1 Tax=Steinernema carpocapsae TaxID=34508 RepID=A0A4U8UVK0_STECR|nr:hypothetical protein L596_004379 [Steinernema carpocapsae]